MKSFFRFSDYFMQICRMIPTSQLEKVYQYMAQFLTGERRAKIEEQSAKSSEFILPVLEDVYQHRNAAAIIRSAEACAFHKIVALQEKNEFCPNIQVAKGAETWVDIEKMPARRSSLQEIRNRGYRVVAVSAERNALMLPDYRITEPVALIFGTEGKGITEETLDFADETLAIPMYGFTRSFNVSVAAAICLYELKQKLMVSGIPHLLNDEECLRLRIRWAVRSVPGGDEIFENYLASGVL